MRFTRQRESHRVAAAAITDCLASVEGGPASSPIPGPDISSTRAEAKSVPTAESAPAKHDATANEMAAIVLGRMDIRVPPPVVLHFMTLSHPVVPT